MSRRPGPPSPEAMLARYKREVEQAAEMAPPLLIAALRADEPGAELDLSTSPYRTPRDALDAMADLVDAGLLPPLLWVVIASESWTTKAPPPGAADTLERGELEARRSIGMSGIDEGVTIHMQHADGSGWAIYSLFERRPALRAVAWRDLVISHGRPGEPELKGGLVDALLGVVGRGAEVTR